jgi:hypothetical protein
MGVSLGDRKITLVYAHPLLPPPAMVKRPFTTIAASLSALIAITHLFRLLRGWNYIVNDVNLGSWVSVVILITAGGLAWLLVLEGRK